MRDRSLHHGSIYRFASLLALAGSASAHSWVEYASKIAPNGTLVGALGFPRGYMPRSQAGWNDKIPQLLLPAQGTQAYTGKEVLNKFPFTDKPQHPMLEAAPGDHIAIIHLENGHVSLPQNQPKKPKNRGTIFLYGTSQPKEQEKLFDVHLLWNKGGSGGDKRGVLLATRNYDDGQCFQPNTASITNERVSKYGADGAKNSQELPCQSDVKLPDNLKPGSVYTIYWYWDWPNLDSTKIDMEKTAQGAFPWAGSFMRGDKVPNGWKMDAITLNESYASVIDIKIGEAPKGFNAKDAGKDAWVAKQNIYSMAIKDQMNNNFQVDVDGYGNGGGQGTAPPPASPSAPASAPGSSPSGAPVASGPQSQPRGITTVKETVTVPATTLITTVFRTVTPSHSQEELPLETTVTVTTRVPPPAVFVTSRPGNASGGTGSSPEPTGKPGYRVKRF
ncbi:hypothetical protein VFPPC_14397 [Pochonia chlamydosporia 170]|uniref:DUF7492 domain-containing protein n=1 Tax=Pochonia chlamydosporia 170 TaxID=1380566 RepID=A0A179FMU0_METCM|nr:hypothetical protein VFPPC_14397 [Pochonia chlamydosporia 170]OAQ66902.1 hypothetical protein VFPPC_14397 [Pochonia chlamydosporia 170]